MLVNRSGHLGMVSSKMKCAPRYTAWLMSMSHVGGRRIILLNSTRSKKCRLKQTSLIGIFFIYFDQTFLHYIFLCNNLCAQHVLVIVCTYVLRISFRQHIIFAQLGNKFSVVSRSDHIFKESNLDFLFGCWYCADVETKHIAQKNS